MDTRDTRQRQPRGLRDRWRLYAARYGWRAYALPVLTVITAVAIVHPSTSSAEPSSADRPAANSAQSGGAGQGHGATADSVDSRAAAKNFALKTDDATVCATNTVDKAVLVSISAQHVWMCQANKQVYSTAATTGETTTGHNATPTGTWYVQSRETNRYLTGPGYRDYVHYWIPFNGDFGFHDATWQTMPFGSQNYRTEGSHGCVHLPMTAVAWLYRWAVVGSTKVTVTA